MILTEKKPIEEILNSLKKDKEIFLLACNGCPEAAETGGEKALLEMKEALKKGGKNIAGEAIIDFICNKTLVSMRLIRHKAVLKRPTLSLSSPAVSACRLYPMYSIR